MKKNTENADKIHTLDEQHSYDSSYQQSNERLKTNARQKYDQTVFFLFPLKILIIPLSDEIAAITISKITQIKF